MSIVTAFLPLLAGRMTEEERLREGARQDMETLFATANERLKFQVDLAKVVIQSLTVANGGAIVALFTLVGKQGESMIIDPALLKAAFAWFVAGLVTIILAAFGGFLSQYWYHISDLREGWHRQAEMLGNEPGKWDFKGPYARGNVALMAALACAFLSLFCFGMGGWDALSGALRAATIAVPPA